MQIARFCFVATAASLVAMLLAPRHADAQAAAADAGAAAPETIGEIVVTAQRRQESSQRTSLVLDVVSPDSIARAGVASVADIGRVSPGIQISTATMAPQIYIRGVGDFAATTLNNPAIAINVDGVYVARLESLQADFFDLERIEVLKGPQGTLYGRNASGGAVNLITARPRLNEFGGTVSAEVGNYSAVTVTGAVNLPVSPTFALRLAGNYVRRDGFTQQDFGDAKNHAGRIRALWQPNDQFDALFNLSAGHVGGKGPAAVLPESAGLGKFVDGVSPAGRAFIASQIPDGTFGGPNIRSQVVLPDGSEARNDLDFVNASAELNAHFDFATLTVIPAYRQSRISYQGYPFLRVGFGDSFSVPGDTPASTAVLPPHPERSTATSLEARLANESDALKWVVGAYYFRENQSIQYSVDAGPLQQGGLTGKLYTDAIAGFTQLTYSIRPDFRVIGGVRYTSDRRELANGNTYAEPFSIFGFGPPPTFAPIQGPPFAVLVESYAGKRTFSNVSWKGGFEYDIAPQSLLFITASSGFKAGGFNQLAAFSNPGTPTSFEPEKLVAYDIGLKNRFLDNRLQVNVGGFYWDYKNQQVNRFGINSVGGIGIEFVNAQKAEIYGGDFDVIARPWSGGTVNASAEYTHARYKQFVIQSANVPFGSTGCAVSTAVPVVVGPNGPVQNIDCSGKPVTKAPQWTGSLGIGQDIALGESGKLTLTADVAFSSSRELTFDFVPATHADSFQVYNATVGFTPRSERFKVMAFVRNITNEQVMTGGSQPNFAPNTLVGSVQLPRTYGARFSFDY